MHRAILFVSVFLLLILTASAQEQVEPDIFAGNTPKPTLAPGTTLPPTLPPTPSSTPRPSTPTPTPAPASNRTNSTVSPTHGPTKAPVVPTVYGIGYSDSNCTQGEVGFTFAPSIGFVGNYCQPITYNGVTAGFMSALLKNNTLFQSCVYTAGNCNITTLDYCQNYTIGVCTQVADDPTQYILYSLVTPASTSIAPLAALSTGLLFLAGLSLLF